MLLASRDEMVGGARSMRFDGGAVSNSMGRDVSYLAVRPEGAHHLCRRIPPRELSIDLVADGQFGRDAAALRRRGKARVRSWPERRFAVMQRYVWSLGLLSVVSAVPIELVDQLMHNDNVFGLSMLCKAAALDWTIMHAIMSARPGADGLRAVELDEASSTYLRLSPGSAQRALRFWQRNAGGPPSISG